METNRIEMSRRERDVLKVMSLVLSGKRTQAESARLLCRSERQARRLQRRLEKHGDGGVVHRLRGRRSNNAMEKASRRKALSLCRKHYVGFGPTLAGMIDDATDRIVCRFVESETTEAYMDVPGRWIGKHGRPASWYSGRHGIFRAGEKVAGYDEKRSVPTQFSRALKELGIELILAGSPQAKGRVERLWGTAQDRLVKELRLAKAGTIERANAVLEQKFMPWFNRRCTHPPASANEAHRPLGKRQNLEAILSIQETRVVANDYTIRFENRVYQLPPPAWPGLRGGKVIVERRADGSMKIRFKGRYLEHRAVKDEKEGDGEVLGTPPPSPRSLAPKPIPAPGGPARKQEGRGDESTRPAVHRPAGRSGRTPAEPCPSGGGSCGGGKEAWRPSPNHPWR